MKKILQLVLWFTLLTLLACSKNGKQGSEDDTDLSQNKDNSETFELDSTSLSKLKKVYFLNLDLYYQDKFLKGYYEATDSSQVVAIFGFGDTIPLIEDLKDGWLAVYANLGQRKYDSSLGKAYIKKDDLGNIDGLILKEEDFRLITDSTGSVYSLDPNTLKIDLISKKEFEEKLKTSIVSTEDVKHGIKQEKGALSLATGNGIINLKDKDPLIDSTLHDEQSLTYSYQGFNKELNAHIVKYQEWKFSGYNLYSQATGEIIASTKGYPCFSENANLLIDIAFNPYDNITEFHLQKKDSKGRYETLKSFHFKKWAPAFPSIGEKGSYFFGKDGAVYIKTIIIEGAYTALEEVKSITQYIKLSVEPKKI